MVEAATRTSLTFTAVTWLNADQRTRTEYIFGKNTRSESGSHVSIHNRDLSYVFEVDLAKRIYTAIRTNKYGGPRGTSPFAEKPASYSGRTLRTQAWYADTGESRSFCGYIAKRILTNQRETEGSRLLSELECDGWYIDPPLAWLNLHSPPGDALYRLSGPEIDRVEMSEVGRRPNGFAVSLNRTHRYFAYDDAERLKAYETTFKEEVSEISEAPLARHLFLPPDGFQRVAQLPTGVRYRFGYRVRLHWELYKDSLPFRSRLKKFASPQHVSA